MSNKKKVVRAAEPTLKIFLPQTPADIGEVLQDYFMTVAISNDLGITPADFFFEAARWLSRALVVEDMFYTAGLMQRVQDRIGGERQWRLEYAPAEDEEEDAA